MAYSPSRRSFPSLEKRKKRDGSEPNGLQMKKKRAEVPEKFVEQSFIGNQ